MASSKPSLVLVTVGVQTLIAMSLCGVMGYLLVLTWQSRKGDSFGGMAMGSAVLGVITLAAVIGCAGLWKSRRWGWWVALLGNLAGFVTFVWGPIEDRLRPDPDELAFIVAFAVSILLCLLPAVRKHCLRASEES